MRAASSADRAAASSADGHNRDPFYMYFLIISLCRRLREASSSFDRDMIESRCPAAASSAARSSFAEGARSSFAEGVSSRSGAVSTATGSSTVAATVIVAPSVAASCASRCWSRSWRAEDRAERSADRAMFARSVVFLRSRHDRVALSPRVLQHPCGNARPIYWHNRDPFDPSIFTPPLNGGDWI